MLEAEVEVIYTSDVYDSNPAKPSNLGDAGIDLRSTTNFSLYPGQVSKIPLGLKINIKTPGVFAMITPRSGLGTKGLVLANTVGIIDQGYQGELIMSAFNRNLDSVVRVIKGERICQLIFVPFCTPRALKTVESFEASSRGESGFGSTGNL